MSSSSGKKRKVDQIDIGELYSPSPKKQQPKKKQQKQSGSKKRNVDQIDIGELYTSDQQEQQSKKKQKKQMGSHIEQERTIEFDEIYNVPKPLHHHSVSNSVSNSSISNTGSLWIAFAALAIPIGIVATMATSISKRK